MRRRIIALLLAGASLTAVAPPAEAIFGVGDIVIDPTNLVQNILTAANTLEQINNQIEQLQNEAEMLINQAENLAALDHDSLSDLIRILEQIDALLREGDEISYEVEESERRYAETFPDSYEDLTNEEIVERATDQWRLSHRGFGHAIKVQSGIVTSLAEARETLSTLVTESQAAGGNLSVAQAGNQLIALGVEQQMQMQTLMAAHYRMIAMEEARRAAIEEQSRVRHERFVGGRSAYTRN
ncbi:MAG TPA: P-type conjugative transfer protein TrbJ [Hyphomonas sp.]|uniref:P-type conjugative transfer protein TrbJ n=1 Tax=uncultured Hyphomonas sp. TaxID=225298 RepID=UPI000C4EEA05|nr:P-type conjugative transfer protein TrbJ [Hyphomonas sp.]MAN91718.1 P-type conjugative transfer protein TrbJ [Hyphomonadaceae bacterium]HBL93053.1 P-type conjugative transfer protein TrbJ [Hyphomonas sp.]HCJ18884.1 P-type conjugative transfer protein TrbJ [Hyphomonas sp.]|tara:strand:- start:11811 stop:12533 length:723 start_codon:yes stop_codon:yes gene_type:complete